MAGTEHGGRLPSGGAVVGGLVLGAGAAGTLFCDRLGLDGQTPFVQLIAFRPQLTAALIVLVLLLAAGARRSRGLLPAALTMALVALAGVVTVAPRVTAPAGAAPGGSTLTVLSLNTYYGEADPDAVADLVRSRNVDLVALPEGGGDFRRRLQGRLDEAAGGKGYRSAVADAGQDGSPMTVFVRSGLGRADISVNRAGEFPTIVARLPRVQFVATHPQSPKPGDTGQWRRDIARLGSWCSAGRPTIVAGDMNATVDHSGFRAATAGCTDAASTTGRGLTGTWPDWAPRVLGAQIDHVLVGGGPQPTGVDVAEVPGTDHRAVIATVRTG